MLRRLRQVSKLRLGNLDAKRDWGHAEDYVRGMWKMLQQDSADDYVIATGETHSVREFLEIAFDHIGISDWEQYSHRPRVLSSGGSGLLTRVPAKANTKLKWKPNISFAELVQRMVESDINEAKLRRPSLQGV